MATVNGTVEAKIAISLSNEAEKKMNEILEKAAREVVELYTVTTDLVFKPDNEKAEFSVGDVVHLKSGGPEMTIFSIESGYAKTVYFLTDWTQAMESNPIPLSCLEK